jgi:integrase/recombinase XerD
MFEILFSRPSAIRRHFNAPFCAQREAYLRRLADRGSPFGVVRRAAYVCRWVAERIRRWPHDQPLQDEDIAMLATSWARRRATNRRRAVPRPSPKESFRSVAKGFLREAGMLASEPIPPVGPYEDRVQAFLGEQHEASGLAPATCSFRGRQARRFMTHLEAKGICLEDLRPSHLDDYFHHLATSWCRVSLRSAAVALRAWLRYCETKTWVRPALAKAILVPRIYRHEGLPLGPTWEQVSRVLEQTDGGKSAQLRARAVLLLLAVYGMRSGEVRRLRLDDIAWKQATIHVVRSKSGRQDTYPLDTTVGNAIARYLRHGRPRSESRFLFLTTQVPFRPLSQGALYSIVQHRARVTLTTKGCSPHALRHACARRLVDAGLSLKEIGDHLGHRSSEATSIYAKVDLSGLRLVALEDLRGLA